MPSSFVRNTFFGFLSGAAIALATFVGSVVVARLLGPEGAGVMAYAGWCILVAATIADMGIGMVLQRFIPKLRAEGKHGEAEGLIGTSVRLSVPAVIAGSVLLFSWLYWPGSSAIDGSSGESHLVLIMLVLAGFIGRGMGQFYAAYLKGEQRFDSLASLSLFSSLIQMVVTVVGAWLFGIAGALAAYAAGSVLPALLGSRLLRKKPGVSRDLRSHVVPFALTSWLAGVIGGLVWNRTEIVFLEHYVDIRAVGFFAAASTLALMATAVPELLTSALLPYFSEQHGLDAREQTHRVYRTMTGIVALVVVPACVGMAAIAHLLVPLIFGAEFADAAPVAMVLLIPAGVEVVAATAPSLIYSTGKSSILLISNTLGLAGTILLALIVIPRFGLMGAAWSRAVVHVGVVAIETWYVSRKLGFAPPYRALAAITLAALIQGLVAYGLIIGVGGVTSLVLALPAAIIVYMLGLRALAVLPMLDPALVDKAIAHAPRQVRPVLSRILQLMSPGSKGRFAPD
jgi:O-antigen/teichoic acid export membrane protein